MPAEHDQKITHSYAVHYPEHAPREEDSQCSIDDCAESSKSRGMCKKHYGSWYYYQNKQRYFDRAEQWKQDNPEKVAKSKKKWLDNNKDYAKDYYEANREKLVDRANSWNKDNPEKARSNARKYRNSHPEAGRANVRRRRAIKASIPTSRYSEAEVYARDGWACQLCHAPVDSKLRWPDVNSKSIDHIIPVTVEGSTDTFDNVQLAHLGCNSSKGNRYHAGSS
jgi:hypothetical protein